VSKSVRCGGGNIDIEGGGDGSTENAPGALLDEIVPPVGAQKAPALCAKRVQHRAWQDTVQDKEASGMELAQLLR
jgi:hypothetical protein